MTDLNADRWENKRLSWAAPGYVGGITPPKLAFRREWTYEGEPEPWRGVMPALVPHCVRPRPDRFCVQTALKWQEIIANRHDLPAQLLKRAYLRKGPDQRKLPLERLLANQEAAEANPHDSRRSDLLVNVGRILQLFARYGNHKTKFLEDPHRPGSPPSLEKIALLGELSYASAKSGLDWLELWGICDQPFRSVDERPNRRPGESSHVTTKPSWRRIDWDAVFALFAEFGDVRLYVEAFHNVGGKTRQRQFLKEQEKKKPKPTAKKPSRRRELRELQGARPSLEEPDAGSAIVAAIMAKIQASMVSSKRLTSGERLALMEAIKAEHPDWEMPQLLAEVSRRCAPPPNADGAAGTETPDRADD